MKKAYRSLPLRFHIHEDASKVMQMINEAKEGLEDTMHNNDAIREEERVCMIEGTIILSYDGNYDSETSEISS